MRVDPLLGSAGAAGDYVVGRSPAPLRPDVRVAEPAVAGSTSGGNRGRKARRRLSRDGSLPYLLMAPAVLAILLVQVVPMLAAVAMSFLRLNQFTIADWTHAPFIGFDNYGVVLGSWNVISQALVRSFAVTLAYTVIVVGMSCLLGMLAAVFLADEVRGRRLFGSVFMIAFALPSFCATILWAFLFQPNGAVNAVFGSGLGLLPGDTFWFAGDRAFWAMCVNTLWRTWPFAFLMLLPAVQGISHELQEAARVDGASRWREFSSITFPLTRRIVLLVGLIISFWTFNDFTTPYIMFSTAAPQTADVLSLAIYRISFVNLNFGLGSALSLLMITFLIGFSILYIRILRVDIGAQST